MNPSDDNLFDLLDDDNLFEEGVDYTKASKRLGEEDKDLLKSLERKVEEVEDEVDDPK